MKTSWGLPMLSTNYRSFVLAIILFSFTSMAMATEAESCSEDNQNFLAEVLQVAKDTDSCFTVKKGNHKNDNIADYCTCLYKKIDKGTIPKLTSNDVELYSRLIDEHNQDQTKEQVNELLAGMVSDSSTLYMARYMTRDASSESANCEIQKVEDENCSEKAKGELQKIVGMPIHEYLDAVNLGIKVRIRDAHHEETFVGGLQKYSERSTELVAKVLRGQKITSDEEKYFREIILTTHPEFSHYSFMVNGKKVQSPFASSLAELPFYQDILRKDEKMKTDRYYFNKSLRSDLESLMTRSRIITSVEKNCQQMRSKIVLACMAIDQGNTNISRTDLSYLRHRASDQDVKWLSEENAKDDKQYAFYRDYIEGRFMCVLNSCMRGSALKDKQAEERYDQMLDKFPSLRSSSAGMMGSFTCSETTSIQTELPAKTSSTVTTRTTKIKEGEKVLTSFFSTGKREKDVSQGIASSQTASSSIGPALETNIPASSSEGKSDSSSGESAQLLPSGTSSIHSPVSFTPTSSSTPETPAPVASDKVSAQTPTTPSSDIERRIEIAEKKLSQSLEDDQGDDGTKGKKKSSKKSAETESLRQEIASLKEQLSQLSAATAAKNTSPSAPSGRNNRPQSSKGIVEASSSEDYQQAPRVEATKNNKLSSSTSAPATQKIDSTASEQLSTSSQRQISAKSVIGPLLTASEATNAVYVAQDDLKLADKNYINELFKRTDGAIIYTTELAEDGREIVVIYEPVIDLQGNVLEYRIKNEKKLAEPTPAKKEKKESKEESKRARLKVEQLQQLIKKNTTSTGQ